MNTVIWTTLLPLIILFLVLGIKLWQGKWTGAIAGYNTMRPEERAKYDMLAVGRFTALIMFVSALAMLLIGIGAQTATSWLINGSGIFLVIFTVGSVIYGNTGGRFLKDKTTRPARSKATNIIALGVGCLTVLLVGIVWYNGFRPPVVEVGTTNIQIQGWYGTTVDFDQITNIQLIDETMQEIGIGSRNNGFNGGGATLRGHFDAGLLFVHSTTSPTLRIDRQDQQPIFISYADSRQTQELYHEISSALN